MTYAVIVAGMAATLYIIWITGGRIHRMPPGRGRTAGNALMWAWFVGLIILWTMTGAFWSLSGEPVGWLVVVLTVAALVTAAERGCHDLSVVRDE